MLNTSLDRYTQDTGRSSQSTIVFVCTTDDCLEYQQEYDVYGEVYMGRFFPDDTGCPECGHTGREI